MTNTEPAEQKPRNRRIRGLDADQRREQRRHQLLESALELFAAQGYLNTSIEQICQNAYVGTKGFYETFDGREDCYLALLRFVSEQLKEEMTARVAATAAPDEDALVAAFAHGVIDDPRRAAVTFGQAGAISQAVERQRRDNRRWAADFVLSLWAERGLDAPRAVAIGLIGGLFDLIADWLLDADPADPAQVDLLIAALTAFYSAVRTGLTRSG